MAVQGKVTVEWVARGQKVVTAIPVDWVQTSGTFVHQLSTNRYFFKIIIVSSFD